MVYILVLQWCISWFYNAGFTMVYILVLQWLHHDAKMWLRATGNIGLCTEFVNLIDFSIKCHPKLNRNDNLV